MPCWWNALLMKWLVDEMPCWWNLMKCLVDEMPCWWKLMKYLVDEMPCWWKLMKCLVGQMSKWLVNEISSWQNMHSKDWPIDQMSKRQTKKFQVIDPDKKNSEQFAKKKVFEKATYFWFLNLDFFEVLSHVKILSKLRVTHFSSATHVKIKTFSSTKIS
jgi:hypothetical protein